MPSPDPSHQKDLDHFNKCYAKIRPYLRRNTFPLKAGWKYQKHEESLAVSFSLWESSLVGFAFGLSEMNHFFIAIYSSSKTETIALAAELRRNERKVRASLGKAFFWEDDNDFLIGEYVDADRPQAAAKRLTIYRDALTPYIDRILPRQNR
jgi:hypothetical protein